MGTDTLIVLEKTATQAVIDAADTAALEALRVRLLGKEGEITSLLKTLGSLPADERKAFGARVNVLKDKVAAEIAARKAALEEIEITARLEKERVDITLPAAARTVGLMHPVSAVIEEVGLILSRLGFAHAVGPEMEEDFYNFTALNIPENHPARQDHDTFYLQQNDQNNRPLLLRTHTSPVQIRAMQAQGAPLRVMAIGRVYRCDSDLTHTPQFHQVEGLAVERGLHFGHLKGVLKRFMSDFFEREVNVRLRVSYFPFVEPGAEVDVECVFCSGKGCRVCKQTGWLEVLGSGMVHRKVLQHGGIDAHVYSGFAFGCGIERLAMLKYGIGDLRMFYESRVPFLQHFGRSAASVGVV